MEDKVQLVEDKVKTLKEKNECQNKLIVATEKIADLKVKLAESNYHQIDRCKCMFMYIVS